MNRLSADNVTLAYDQRVIAEQLSVEIPDNSFTVIVGPNACGKSTLLRALSRMLKPSRGPGAARRERHPVDAREEGRADARPAARSRPIAPDGITVADLVGRGRYPHQGILRQWSTEDERVVQESMRQTGVAELAERYVDELSGGQRQRVWIAMALAQQTPLLLLDEPTTYLDIQHQIDVLDLCARSCTRSRGARSSPSCTTSTTPPGTPRISSRCARAGSSPRARRTTSSRRTWSRRSSGCAARSSTTRRRGHRWWCRRPARPGPGRVGTAGCGIRAVALQKLPELEQVPEPASSFTRPEPQALAKFSSPSTRATRSSPDMASLIWAFSWRRAPEGVPHLDPAARHPADEGDVEVGDVAAHRAVHDAAASRRPLRRAACCPRACRVRLRHSSIVAIVIDGTPAVRGSVGA